MSSSKVWSRSKVGSFYPWIHAEPWISQPFLPDRKVLWMTLGQLFEMLIKFFMFDSNRATCILLRGQNQLLVPSGWGKARKPTFFSWESFPRTPRIDRERKQKISESYINNMPKAFSWNTYFMSNLYSEKCHFTGESIGDQPCTFASFSRFAGFGWHPVVMPPHS